MVIGNGFFTDTESDALMQMQKISGCEVRRCVFPTIGNIVYYISVTGDIYGVQDIQGKKLTRAKKNVRNKGYISARLSTAPKKEAFVPLQLLTYCTFTLREWNPDIELEFINGNGYDVRPKNLRPAKKRIPAEWSEHMQWRQDMYSSNFLKVAWSVNYITGLNIEDCKDMAQTAFIYLCTDGYNKTQHRTDIVGLWVKIARLRAYDYLRCHVLADSDAVEMYGKSDREYEIDMFSLQAGERRQRYLRMWAEGNTPTEIAQECGSKSATVSASVSKSIQFLQRYFYKELKNKTI